MRVRVVVVAVVVATIVAAASWWFLRGPSTTYEQALDTLPATTLRAAYTDWEQARSHVESSDLSEFIDGAYEADLTRASALESSATDLDEIFAVDLAEAEWEIYGQSDEGSVSVLRVGDHTSYSALRGTLDRAGYAEPDEGTGAWTADEGLVAGLSPSLTPVHENLVLVENEQLVIFSDDAAYAERTAAVVEGGEDSLLDPVQDLVSHTGRPVSAVLWASDFACGALSMSSADEADQSLAEDLIAEAGGVDPVSGLVMARSEQGAVTVTMEFESGAQASDNLQPRTDLASGDSPGIGGSFTDLFTVTSGTSDDRLVVLELEPRDEDAAYFNTITTGPTLFATC